MLILVIGGSGSGKSEYAEKRILGMGGEKKIYLATMETDSEAARERIRRHRELREGKGFVTVERQRNLKELQIEKGADVLLEDLGNLVANELFAGETPAQGGNSCVGEVLACEDKFFSGSADGRTMFPVLWEGLHHIKRQARSLVVVTNDIFSDGVSYEGEMLKYQKLLADCNRFLAEKADEVIEIVCGQPVRNHLPGRTGQEAKSGAEMRKAMIFVVGGAFQGKEEYVRKVFSPKRTADAEKASSEELRNCDCILNYHKLVRRQVENGEDSLEMAEELMEKNPNAVITMDEVGSGIVPMNKAECAYREQAGRVASFFAENAEAVYRLICGIPQKLK